MGLHLGWPLHRLLGNVGSDVPLFNTINTGTTMVTFLMVFLIQNTQNRDARAINLKLDELIRAIDKARDQMMNTEKLSDVELDVLEAQFEKIRVAGARNRGGQVRRRNWLTACC